MIDVLTNATLFIDGKGYAGRIKEMQLPKLQLKVQELHAGGMAAPVEIPMAAIDKLEAEITLASFEPDTFKLWAVEPGKTIQVTARGALASDDGAVRPIVVNLTGIVREMDTGSWKPAEDAELKLTLSARYYKLSIDGAELIEVDAINYVFKVDGQDQLADARKALGL